MTLTGTISPALAGTLFAALVGPIGADRVIALLLSAVFIQTATNMFNDYFDFQNGQDQEKWVTSEEALFHSGPPHRLIPYVAGTILLFAVVVGIWLAIISNPWILVVGALGIIAGYAYSAGRHCFSKIGLGELVAAVFLGPVITVLAYVIEGHQLSFDIIFLSLPFALLIASMVLTNNIRDLEKDRGFRKTLAAFIGRNGAVTLLKTLVLLPYLIVLSLIVFRVVPSSTTIVILALPVGIRLFRSFRLETNRNDEINGMKWAVRHHWAFGILFVIGLWMSI